MTAAKIALLLGVGAFASHFGRGTTTCQPCSGTSLLLPLHDQSSLATFCPQQPPQAGSLKDKPSKATLATIYGKIQIVDSFADYKVKIVDSFPDLKVQIVDSLPNGPGKWQYVESFPDFKIQFVDSFPDFKIQFVKAFPGLP
jgi:hypothetical protein